MPTSTEALCTVIPSPTHSIPENPPITKQSPIRCLSPSELAPQTSSFVNISFPPVRKRKHPRSSHSFPKSSDNRDIEALPNVPKKGLQVHPSYDYNLSSYCVHIFYIHIFYIHTYLAPCNNYFTVTLPSPGCSINSSQSSGRVSRCPS